MDGNGDLKIWRLERYEDAEGRVVIQRNPLKDGKAEYFGHGTVRVNHEGGRSEVNLAFFIPAEGVREAFGGWKEAYEKAVQAFRADLNRPRLLVPK